MYVPTYTCVIMPHKTHTPEDSNLVSRGWAICPMQRVKENDYSYSDSSDL